MTASESRWHGTSLGFVQHRLGHHHDATASYRRALDQFRDLDRRHLQAVTLADLGDVHHDAGQPAAARDAWKQALDIFTDLDHPHAAQVRAKLAGR